MWAFDAAGLFAQILEAECNGCYNMEESHLVEPTRLTGENIRIKIIQSKQYETHNITLFIGNKKLVMSIKHSYEHVIYKIFW